jgi:hypothetical protein
MQGVPLLIEIDSGFCDKSMETTFGKRRIYLGYLEIADCWP